MSPLQGWLLDEGNALKQKLTGFSVLANDGVTQTPIGVWYRFPDAELRQRTFPHFQIDMIDIEFDATRAHRAAYHIVEGTIEQATPQSGTILVADDFPLPWTIVYQIGAYSRLPRHDWQMQALMHQMFPQQYGSLNMTDIDGTVRRADLRGMVRRDMMEPTGQGEGNRKRLYRFIVTIGVSTEFYANEILALGQITGISLDINVLGTNLSESVTVPPATEGVGRVIFDGAGAVSV